MSRGLYRLGHWCATHPWRTVGAWLAAVVMIVAVGNAAGGETIDTFEIPGTESQTAFDLLDERFPARSGSTARVVFHTDGGTVLDDDAAAGIAASLRAFAELDRVTDVTALYGGIR